MKEHMGLWATIGLIIIIIGTITSVKTILKIYGDNITNENENENENHDMDQKDGHTNMNQNNNNNSNNNSNNSK